MKGLVKILVIAAIVYMAYNYYVRNYTTEGKKSVAKEEQDKAALAEKERVVAREQAMDGCRAIYATPNMSEGEKWNQYLICEANVNAIYGK